MPPTYDWKPSVQNYPEDKYSCHILRLVWTHGAYMDDKRSPKAQHYDHPSTEAAEKCAWQQIAQLRREQAAE
jgi:hypothetical protein